jgi:hypothetical protein
MNISTLVRYIESHGIPVVVTPEGKLEVIEILTDLANPGSLIEETHYLPAELEAVRNWLGY